MTESGRIAEYYDEHIGSLLDASAIVRAVEGVEAALHLGALMSWDSADSRRMFLTNCEGTRTLAEASSAAGVKRFVFASSGEVYPENNPVELPISESLPCNPTSPYGLTKLLGEEIVQFHRREGLMETVILRFAHTQDASELLDERAASSPARASFSVRASGSRNASGIERLQVSFESWTQGCPPTSCPETRTAAPFKCTLPTPATL